jgi:signal peptidase
MGRGEFVSRILLLLISVAAVTLVLGHSLGYPLLLGFVETGSMQPTLEPNDGFVAIPTPLAGPIEEGDVVTFRAEEIRGGGLTTHRVVGETDGGYVTRGDANPFTDQQAGEPPVRRSEIVAVALQVGGEVVVLPNLGGVVAATRSVFALVGDALGLDGGPTQLATVLFAALSGAFLLDELLAESEDERPEHRSTSRDAGYDADRLLVAGVALVLVVATLSMTLPSGVETVTYDSVEPERASGGGIPAGGERAVPLKFSNGGYVPTVVFLDAPDGAPLSSDLVVLGPRERASVNLTVAAPSDPGRYEQRVVQHRYVGVFPVPVLRALHAVHPWLAVTAVDAFVGTVLVVVGRFLLGRGRLRLRGGRRRSASGELSLRRTLRRLYR